MFVEYSSNHHLIKQSATISKAFFLKRFAKSETLRIFFYHRNCNCDKNPIDFNAIQNKKDEHYCSSLNFLFVKIVQFQKVRISKSHITNFETLPLLLADAEINFPYFIRVKQC